MSTLPVSEGPRSPEGMPFVAPCRTLEMTAPLRWLNLVSAIVLLFAMKIMATLVAAGLAPSKPREELSPFIELARSRSGWLVFLAVVVLAGATEELLFRGVLSRTLEARIGLPATRCDTSAPSVQPIISQPNWTLKAWTKLWAISSM